MYRSAESLVLGPALVDLAGALREADGKLFALGGCIDPPGTERSEFRASHDRTVLDAP